MGLFIAIIGSLGRGGAETWAIAWGQSAWVQSSNFRIITFLVRCKCGFCDSDAQLQARKSRECETALAVEYMIA